MELLERSKTGISKVLGKGSKREARGVGACSFQIFSGLHKFFFFADDEL
jgi:hypothetical protein